MPIQIGFLSDICYL